MNTNFLYQNDEEITVDAYFEEWIGRKRLTARGNTIKTYKNRYYKHIAPFFGSRMVKSIVRREVLKLQHALAEEYTVRTANDAIKLLGMILNDAVRDEVIEKNPAASVSAVRKMEDKAADTYHRALTEEEQQLFMSALAGNHYYGFIAFLLCTGMRSGEAAALCWEDIDEKANMIRINKTFTFDENGGPSVGPPKSLSSVREIPLTETTRYILYLQQKKVPKVRGQIIFPASTGGMINNHAVNRAIDKTRKYLEEQGTTIRPFTAHALRDTFATRFIEQGGNPQTLKTILGHSSLHMTMDLYSHVLPSTKQKEMDMLRIYV